MPSICVEADVAAVAAGEAFEAVCDLDRYPQRTDAVLEVTSDPVVEGRAVSHWAVGFRDGILRWSEEDRRDDGRRVLEFDQVEGDFESFSGRWAVDAAGDGCTVRFDAEFDFGMPSIGPMIDPLAQVALHDNVVEMLTGVFGEAVSVTSRPPHGDPVPAGVAT